MSYTLTLPERIYTAKIKAAPIWWRYSFGIAGFGAIAVNRVIYLADAETAKNVNLWMELAAKNDGVLNLPNEDYYNELKRFFDVVNHELIHFAQQDELGAEFYLRYVGQFARNSFPFFLNFRANYRNIAFEQEAKAFEEDWWDYLDTRPPYAWKRFL